jgi:two-component system response regulator RpfG
MERIPKDVVVILDDQQTSRLVLGRLIQSLDRLQCITFSEPDECLTWLSKHRADLVVADYKMPGMDGIEFVRRFRALPHSHEVPVVMITVVEDREVRLKSLEAGVTDFIHKPFDHAECRVRVRNLLMLRRQQHVVKNRAQWLETQVSEAVQAIRVREQETLLRLAKAGEYRDEETGHHIERMAKYSRLIAEGLGLPAEECDTIELAAPMHDIGKIGVPDSILLKPGRHTPEEFALMKRHTTIGYEILKGSPSLYLQVGAVIALGHHEKFNGAGYPSGLYGEEIPLPARIVALADVFDALTSARAYKSAWPFEQAVHYLETQVAMDFDPDCLEAFRNNLARINEIYLSLQDLESNRETAQQALDV